MGMLQLLETTNLDKEQKTYLRSSMGIYTNSINFEILPIFDHRCRKCKYSPYPDQRYFGF